MHSLKKFFNSVKTFIVKTLRIVTRPFLSLAKRIVLPGFQGISLYDTGVYFIKGAQQGSLPLRANAITYSFILAFVPAILFLFTLIPYIPVEGLQENILDIIEEIMPIKAYELIHKTIEDIITRGQSGLLSVSFLLSIFYASSGIFAIMNAFNQTSHSIETRTNFKKRIVSLLLVIILGMTVIISAGSMVFSSFIFYKMEIQGIIGDNLTLFVLNAGQWLTILLTSMIAFSCIYYFAPAKRGIFHFFSPGSVLASFLSVIAFKIFVIFINQFSHVNTFYGSLGTLIVILMWINLTAFMLLIGFELNASIFEAKKNKS